MGHTLASRMQQETRSLDQSSAPLHLDAVIMCAAQPNKHLLCVVVVSLCSTPRSSRSVSKGAQWILYRSQVFGSLAEAVADADLSVALTRWLPDQPNCLPDLPSLLQQPLVQQVLRQPLGRAQQLQQAQAQPQQPLQATHRSPQHVAEHAQQGGGQQAPKPVQLALVFGREEFGLSDDEVAACDLACSIPIGRLQVSGARAHTHSCCSCAESSSTCTAMHANVGAPSCSRTRPCSANCI